MVDVMPLMEMSRTLSTLCTVLVVSVAAVPQALAQENEFAVTLDIVLNDVGDVDSEILPAIAVELERVERDDAVGADLERESRERVEDELIEGDRADPDGYDDGEFDDYDDGEEVDTGVEDMGFLEDELELAAPPD